MEIAWVLECGAGRFWCYTFSQVVATFGNTTDVLTRRGNPLELGNRVINFKVGIGGLIEKYTILIIIFHLSTYPLKLHVFLRRKYCQKGYIRALEGNRSDFQNYVLPIQSLRGIQCQTRVLPCSQRQNETFKTIHCFFRKYTMCLFSNFTKIILKISIHMEK